MIVLCNLGFQEYRLRGIGLKPSEITLINTKSQLLIQ